MSKRVEIGTRPTTRRTAPEADAWVENRAASNEPEPIKRLTIDVPESLHRRVKAQCAMRGTKIADEVRALLVEHFPEQPK